MMHMLKTTYLRIYYKITIYIIWILVFIKSHYNYEYNIENHNFYVFVN